MFTEDVLAFRFSGHARAFFQLHIFCCCCFFNCVSHLVSGIDDHCSFFAHSATPFLFDISGLILRAGVPVRARRNGSSQVITLTVLRPSWSKKRASKSKGLVAICEEIAMKPARTKSVLVLAPCTDGVVVTVSFMSALSGARIGTVPWATGTPLHVTELERRGVPVLGYDAVLGSTKLPIDGLCISTITGEVSELEVWIVRRAGIVNIFELLLPPLAAPYAQQGFQFDPALPNGRRRWYKEFREFARHAHAVAPDDVISMDGSGDCAFHGVAVLELMPLILQAAAADARALHSSYRRPQRWRSWSGCVHSIVMRTSGSCHDARLFVLSWLELNKDIVMELESSVKRFPHRNFFL